VQKNSCKKCNNVLRLQHRPFLSDCGQQRLVFAHFEHCGDDGMLFRAQIHHLCVEWWWIQEVKTQQRPSATIHPTTTYHNGAAVLPETARKTVLWIVLIKRVLFQQDQHFSLAVIALNPFQSIETLINNWVLLIIFEHARDDGTTFRGL